MPVTKNIQYRDVFIHHDGEISLSRRAAFVNRQESQSQHGEQRELLPTREHLQFLKEFDRLHILNIIQILQALESNLTIQSLNLKWR